MRTGWALASLTDIARVIRSRRHPKEVPDLPFVGMEDVEGNTGRLLGTSRAAFMRSAAVHFHPGDVLYGRLRPYLNKVIAPDFEGLSSAEFIPLTPTAGVSTRFLRYRLLSSDFVHFASHLNTGDRPRVDFDQLADFRVALPPSEEQGRIVQAIESYFSRLDGARALLERVQRNLKRYRAAVLKAAVEGHLVPTEAELAGAVGRNYEPAGVLLGRILAERRHRWEEVELTRMRAAGRVQANDRWKLDYPEPKGPERSGLPVLPEGWSWATIEQVASADPRSIQSGPFGSNLHHAEFRATGKLVIGIDNVQDGFFSLGEEHRISESRFLELERYSARPGDVLVTVMATIGRCCVVPEDLERAIITKHVYRVSTERRLILPRYLLLALQGSPAVRRQILEDSRGQTRPGLNGAIIRRLVIPVPPLPEQARIVNEADRLLSIWDDASSAVRRAKHRCGSLRRTVLNWAFEGRLVDQDPSDEPASELLERIKAEQAVAELAPAPKARRGRRKRTSAA